MSRLVILPVYLLLAGGAFVLLAIWLFPGGRDEITGVALDALRLAAWATLIAGALVPWERVTLAEPARRGDRTVAVIILLALAVTLAALRALPVGAPDLFLLLPLLALALLGAVREDLTETLAALGVYGALAPTLLLALGLPPAISLALLARLLLAFALLARAARR